MAEITCREKILSNDYADWIIDFPFTDELRNLAQENYDYCYDPVDDEIGVISVRRDQLANISLLSFDYQYLPDLYGLAQIEENTNGVNGVFNSQPLLDSGMISVQHSPLNLTGRGVILAFLDTGIDYNNAVFKNNDGTTRILSIWDQTIQEGTPPDGFLYGTEYTREEINEAIRSENPYDVVPSRDENGHGTRMASVAAGSMIGEGIGFLSPAYECEIIVVKLKECKEYLREYFLIPSDVPAYQSNDIIMAMRYLDTFARAFARPVVFCLGIGSSYGDHLGYSILARYLTDIATRRSRVVMLPGGNEGNSAHHFSGQLSIPNETGLLTTNSIDMEIRVGENEIGFLLQIWVAAPSSLSVSIRTPGGEVVPRTTVLFQRNLQYNFVYERTIITVDYALIEPGSGDELILVRFQNPTPGIWTIVVSNDTQIQNTYFNAWLPITQFLSSQTYFLRPDPEMTLTIPSYAEEAISTSTYDSFTNSFYTNSGRGFSRSMRLKPDFASPGANISTVYGSLGGFPVVSSATGSSLAAALASGGTAQFMQWAVTDMNSPYIRSTEVRNYLIRGASRDPGLTYPNRQWGFGRLNIEGIFNALSRV